MNEGYKLYLYWDGFSYTDGKIVFSLAWFEGPALLNSEPITPDNFIDLDFSKQNSVSGLFLPHHYYIASFAWKSVEYSGGNDKVILGDATLSHHKVGSLREFSNINKILIDCSNHETTSHANFLVYPAWAMTKDDIIT